MKTSLVRERSCVQSAPAAPVVSLKSLGFCTTHVSREVLHRAERCSNMRPKWHAFDTRCSPDVLRRPLRNYPDPTTLLPRGLVTTPAVDPAEDPRRRGAELLPLEHTREAKSRLQALRSGAADMVVSASLGSGLAFTYHPDDAPVRCPPEPRGGPGRKSNASPDAGRKYGDVVGVAPALQCYTPVPQPEEVSS
jgi:hypothetical protein